MPNFDGRGPRSGFNQGRGRGMGPCGGCQRIRSFWSCLNSFRWRRGFDKNEERQYLETELKRIEEEKRTITKKIEELEKE